MNLLRRTPVTLVGLLVPLVAVAAAARAQKTEATETTQTAEPGFLIERNRVEITPHAGVAIADVIVDNRLGDVVVTGHDRPIVALTAIKRAPDGSTLDRLKVNLVPDPSGAIRIGSAILFGDEVRPVPAGTVRIDVQVEIPRGAHVDVKAWNGKIVATGLRAGAKLSAHESDITVTDVAGTISTSAARGRQKLSEIRGNVHADSTYGELSFDGVTGDLLAARLHDGEIQARRIRVERVAFRTTFGRILFSGELLAGGRYDLRSYRGNVDVRIARTPGVKIDAFARDGRVESQLELAESGRPEVGRLVGTFGGATAKPAVLEVSSSVGQVSLGLMNQ